MATNPSPARKAAEAIFAVAVDLSPEDRPNYLLRACGEEIHVRARVEALLKAHEASADFLPESPPSLPGGLRSGSVIGDYELLEEIARGGMGVVCRAYQRSLDRIVAIKLILAGQFASREQALRFRAEAEAAAHLQHQHIVRIYEIAEHEGQQYFSMDFIDGPNLATLVGQQPLAWKRAASYAKQIAEAIHYAHSEGILHRDLKPSNVLIDRSDQPRITDFGLAKRVARQESITSPGDIIGSPGFMPPEQAGAKLGKPDSRSDVYGLGAILFFLITGRAPFVAETLPDMLHQIVDTEPVSPRVLNPSIPIDLATICLKCLEKQPARRYQSAQALAEELGRFLRDEPIVARPVSKIERYWRWCRRNPSIALLSLAVSLLALVVLVGAPLLAIHETNLRLEAEAALNAHRNRDAGAPIRGGDIANSIAILDRAVQRFPDHSHLWNAQGILLEQSGRTEDAVRSFTRALELVKTPPDVHTPEVIEILANRSRALKSLSRFAEAGVDYCRANGIPIRDKSAPETTIDLSLFYNGSLADNLHAWRGSPAKDLKAFPRGVKIFGGAVFDARGIVQLNGTETEIRNPDIRFPLGITNIPINKKFTGFHALMGTGWREEYGVPIASFVLRFKDGAIQELPVLYGVHVKDWIAANIANEDAPLDHGVVAWIGHNEFSQTSSRHVRLYKATWTNSRPNAPVESIDVVTKMTRCLPFVIAITVEP